MRVGLIGCGTHGFNAVVTAAQKYSKRATLVAVADLNPKNLEPVQNAATYTDHRQMLAKEKLDVVYIATLTETHLPLAADAFAAGCHVICEKPMADSVAECQTMIDRAKAANRRLLVTFESRYYPHLRKVRRWIGDGDLGRVDAVHIQQFWDGHKAFGVSGERRKRLMQRAGGLDCGIHKLDQARYLCGGRWRSIDALGAWLDDEIEKPPHIGILGRLDNGVMVTVNASLAYAAFIKPRPMNEVLTVVGTRGVASMAIDAGSVEEFSEGEAYVNLFCETREEKFRVVHTAHYEEIAQLLDDLADVLEHGKPMPPELATGDDGLMAQWAVEEANRKAVLERAGQTR